MDSEEIGKLTLSDNVKYELFIYSSSNHDLIWGTLSLTPINVFLLVTEHFKASINI